MYGNAACEWDVSTHSRPKAAGAKVAEMLGITAVSTHSRPKAAGPIIQPYQTSLKFQHTAARRRLGMMGITKNR